MASSPAGGPGCVGWAGRLVLLVAVVVICLFCLMLALGLVLMQQDQRALTEADRLWAAGDHPAAAAKYHAVTGSSVLNNVQKRVVYGRLIDHEAGSGNGGPAVALAEQALGKNIDPAVSHPAGLAAVAQARAKRGQADPATPAPPERRQELLGPAHDLAAAAERVRRLEQKAAVIRSVMDRAVVERSDVTGRLRSIGVRSAADLSKAGPRGRQLAERVQRLVAEVDHIEAEMAKVEGAILDERSLIRRLELRQAGVTAEETAERLEKLKEVEELTGRPPADLAPLDLEAAVTKALAAHPDKAGR